MTLKFDLINFIYRNSDLLWQINWYLRYSWRKIDSKKIVVSCHQGRSLGCNPKYIVREIIRQKLPYKIIWLVRDEFADREVFAENVKFVNYTDINKRLKELATAKLWIENTCKLHEHRHGLNKKQRQFYLQTWHGSLGIKRMYYDTETFYNNKKTVYYTDKDFSSYDLMLTDSKFEEDVFRSALRYKGKMSRIGHPRNDIFFKDTASLKAKIYEKFNIPLDKKIVLYVPSFRDSLTSSCYDVDYAALKSALSKRFGSDWVVVSKFHPSNLKSPNELLRKRSADIDASYYPDMQELLVCSDVIISDYSSCMFDFMLCERPCFIYATDIEKYNTERGFYYPLESTPFPIAINNSELISNIERFNTDDYREKCRKFLAEKDALEDGKASERAVEIIREIMK